MSEPRDEVVELDTGATLSVRVTPADLVAEGGAARAGAVLVHGLASNARMWDACARALAAEGAAVLVLSADVDEVLEVADRVVVLAAGEIHLDAYGEDAERDRVIQTISASV